MPLFSRIVRRQPRPAPVPAEVFPAPVVSIADHALAEIAENARISLQAAGVAIALESEGVILCRARAGEAAPEIGTPIRPGQGITGECVAAGLVIGCPDTNCDPRVNAEVCRQLGIRSLLLAPLRRQGQVVGVIEALFAAPRLFDETAVESLERFAAQVVAREYGDVGLDTEDAEEVRNQDRGIEVSSVVDSAVATEPAVAKPAAFESATDVLPMFSTVAERKEPPYAVMLAVVVVSTVLLIAGVALSRSGRIASSAARKVAVGDADAWVRLRKLAESGNAAAQYFLAQAYQKGSGMPRDEAEAARWLRRSAEQGNADAQFELAQVLESGRGVAADRVEAGAWYAASGIGGNNQGETAFERLTPQLSTAEIGRVRRRVGEMHAEGKAVPRSVVSAYRWYALAAAAGDAEAKARMSGLSSQMTRQELTEAKVRAAAWINRHR